MTLASDSYYMFLRWMKKLVRNPILLFFSLFQPIISLFLFTVALFGLAWSGISLALGLRTKSAETVFGIAGTLTFPLLFMSTALMDKRLMPEWMKNVSAYNPISFAVNAIRDLIINGYNWNSFLLSFGVISLIAILTMGATIYEFRKVVS